MASLAFTVDTPVAKMIIDKKAKINLFMAWFLLVHIELFVIG